MTLALRKPRLLIIGHGRHGKDTLAQMLSDVMGLVFSSSSHFVAEEFIWEMWGKERYDSFELMFDDRHNHRTLWGNLISAYCTPDKTKTAATMLSRGNHMYVGMRRRDELEGCKKVDVFDHVIWVDACKRLPKEPKESMQLNRSDADIYIDNNEEDPALMMGSILLLQARLHEEGYDVNHSPLRETTKEIAVSKPPSNVLIYGPKIYAIGQTQFNKDEFELWAEHNHLTEMTMDNETPLGRLWSDISDTDAIARMIEFGGRHCYRAWEKGRDRESYIKNILEMEHGSVLEHATINWGIQGVSRSLSLELARHRVGIALSQESQRYVDASEINFVVPPILMNISAFKSTMTEFLELNLDALANYKRLQQTIVESFALEDLSTKEKTMLQKRANEAARAHLPNCTETRFLWTTNMRILLHFLWLRGGSGADLEIRRMAIILLEKAQKYAPEIFSHMTTKEIPDGHGVPIIVRADD